MIDLVWIARHLLFVFQNGRVYFVVIRFILETLENSKNLFPYFFTFHLLSEFSFLEMKIATGSRLVAGRPRARSGFSLAVVCRSSLVYITYSSQYYSSVVEEARGTDGAEISDPTRHGVYQMSYPTSTTTAHWPPPTSRHPLAACQTGH